MPGNIALGFLVIGINNYRRWGKWWDGISASPISLVYAGWPMALNA